MEARPDFHVEKLFCLVVAPTRKLVKSLMQTVNAALEAAGLETRCVHYEDEEVKSETRGVIACCTHSLHKFAEGINIQLMIVDEVAEGIESVSHLDPDGLCVALRAMKHANQIFWADAMAGASVADALRHLEIPPSRCIILDSPEKRPYRGAPFEITIPVTKDGKIAQVRGWWGKPPISRALTDAPATVGGMGGLAPHQNAAIAGLVEACKAGLNVLMTCCTVFAVRVAEKVLQQEGITCRVAHSLLPDTDVYVALFQISRRDEASFLGPGDVVTAVQAYLNSPLISSGISSRNLFDVVIADTQGCTVSAKILMQMIARARDSNTRVRAIVTDSGIVRMPGGPWQHERVDYASAAVDVQKHCKARAISDVMSIEEAKRVLRMADMEKAFGNRRGMITIGVEGAPCIEVPVDDEAFYAYVPSTFGSRKAGMMWVRFARAPSKPSATITQVIKENSRKERLSTAATQNANAKRIGELLCTVDTVGYARESLLARVAAHAGLDAKNLRRNFIPTLEAIVRREERAYAGRPRLHVLSDDDVAAMGSIQAVRQELRLDDVVEYARYERDSLRITTMGEADAVGKRFFTTIEERYEVHLELKAKHIPYQFIFDKVRAAKSARRLEASPETTENEPPTLSRRASVLLMNHNKTTPAMPAKPMTMTMTMTTSRRVQGTRRSSRGKRT
jgi:hypothetical protein